MKSVFIALASVASFASATTPACVLACAAIVAQSNVGCSGIGDVACIAGKNGDSLQSCLSSRCGNSLNDAKVAVKNAASEAGASFDGSGSSSSAPSSSASPSSTSSTAASTSAVAETTTSDASSRSGAAAAAVTTSSAAAAVASTSAASTVAPVSVASAFSHSSAPAVVNGAVHNNVGLAAVAVAVAALI